MGDLPTGADPERIAIIASRSRPWPTAAWRSRSWSAAATSPASRAPRTAWTAPGDYMGMLAGPERAGAPGRAREGRRRHARAVADHDLRGGRALHPPARHAPPREGPDRDLRGRHGQPVLHHGHRGGAAPSRSTRDDPDGEERGGGRVPADPRGAGRGFIEDHAPGDRAAAPGDGLDRLSLCMDNGLPIHVFNMDDERNIDRIVCGERVGTVVRSG